MREGGIVRPPRRPAGWIPPGPPAAAPSDLRPGPEEDLCHLTGAWRIFQRVDGHRWSLDDLVTAWFAAEHAIDPEHVVDLGCGIGSVLLMLAWRFPDAVLRGIEAQALSVDLARRSIAWNGVESRCTVHHGDLRTPPPTLRPRDADLVTGTPPYLPPGTARESARVQKGPCNFEHRGGIEAYADAAARLLRPGGVFVACEQADQDVRTRAAAAAVGLRVTHALPVVPRAGKRALFTVYACRIAGDALDEPPLAPLVVRDAAGRRTPAFVAVRAVMGMPP